MANMPFSMTEDGLHKLFSEHGEVDSVAVITDRHAGRPHGFGFVEMSSRAQDAIHTLNNHEVEGRALKVNEVQTPPRKRLSAFALVELPRGEAITCLSPPTPPTLNRVNSRGSEPCL